MKFVVSRLSNGLNESEPCENVISHKHICPSGYTSTYYTIEINSLEELNQFIEEYGDIIIYKEAHDDPSLRNITIYDDYAE